MQGRVLFHSPFLLVVTSFRIQVHSFFCIRDDQCVVGENLSGRVLNSIDSGGDKSGGEIIMLSKIDRLDAGRDHQENIKKETKRTDPHRPHKINEPKEQPCQDIQGT